MCSLLPSLRSQWLEGNKVAGAAAAMLDKPEALMDDDRDDGKGRGSLLTVELPHVTNLELHREINNPPPYFSHWYLRDLQLYIK